MIAASTKSAAAWMDTLCTGLATRGGHVTASRRVASPLKSRYQARPADTHRRFPLAASAGLMASVQASPQASEVAPRIFHSVDVQPLFHAAIFARLAGAENRE